MTTRFPIPVADGSLAQRGCCIMHGVTQLRVAEPIDRAFLVAMARLACTLADRPLPAIDDPEVLKVLPGKTDAAPIAVDEDGQPVGAAWWHMHTPPLLCDAHGGALPELVMAVAEQPVGVASAASWSTPSPGKRLGAIAR